MSEPERTIWAGGPAKRNWWPLWGLAALAALATAPLFVFLGPAAFASIPVSIALACAALLEGRRNRYTVTTQRVIWESGLLSRHRREVELADIRHLVLKQSFFQRVLGVGAIEIESAAGSAVEVRIAGIAAPARMMERLREARLGAARPVSS